MGIRAKIVTCCLGGGATIALAACGSSTAAGSAASAGSPAAASTRSTATLIAQMIAAVGSATSMHMSGQVSGSGHPVGLDLGVLRAGELTGTITQNGVKQQLIGAEGKVYIKATPAFLRELKASAAVCAVMCGKYVQMSGPQAGALAVSLSMASLTRSLTSGLPHFNQAGTTTVNGQPAIVLHGADGSTLDVAATGKPYPLRVVAPAGRPGVVVFSEWDQVAAPAAPRAGEVINLNQLKAGSS
jgi:hypothetical protein